MGGERRAIELDGVDTHMDKQFNSAIAQQADSMFRLENRGDFPRERRNNFAY